MPPADEGCWHSHSSNKFNAAPAASFNPVCKPALVGVPIELEDAVIAVKRPNGRVKLKQLFHPAAEGAAYGFLWGLIVGLIFLMPLAGVIVCAASGAIGGALSDVGIDDEFMKEVTDSIVSGKAVLFLLIREMTTDKVLADLKGVSGKVLRTSFDAAKEQALRDALAGPVAADSSIKAA